jgi:hypothetical protein
MTRPFLRLQAAGGGAAALLAIAATANGCAPIDCIETATCPDPADVARAGDSVVEASGPAGDASGDAVGRSVGIGDARGNGVDASDAVVETSDASIGASDAVVEASDGAIDASPRDSAVDRFVADAGGADATGSKCGANVLAPSGAVSSPLAMMPASLAIDGNLSTRWESVHAVDPQWIYLDFGAPVFVNRVRILWETACATNYDLQVSNDATAWTTLRSIIGNVQGGPPPTDWTTAVDHTGLVGVGRYVRMTGTARCTSYGYSIWEMQVFGDTNASCHP